MQEMKLTKTDDGYVCESDPRLQFHDRGGRLQSHDRGGQHPWHLHLDGRWHSSGSLADLEADARPHWRPGFLEPGLDRLHGDGLRLWDEAVLGDRQSFLLLLDWVEEHLRP